VATEICARGWRVDYEIRVVEIRVPADVELPPVAYAPVLAKWKLR
jgi:hypothetical protein